MAGIFSFNVGELARPATVLIERISDAVGGIAKPYQVERLAKSESKAAMIRTESDIEISDLRLRAANRFINEEMSKQANMESITAKAIPHLKEDSSPESMNDDWLTNFFEKCRIVSDSNMQDLWASILAGEANAPGAFSRKTVNLMADLEQRDAEIFRNLCRFSWTVPGNIPITPVIFDYEHEIYGRHGISFDSCTHLDTLGLVLFEPEYKPALGGRNDGNAEVTPRRSFDMARGMGTRAWGPAAPARPFDGAQDERPGPAGWIHARGALSAGSGAGMTKGS